MNKIRFLRKSCGLTGLVLVVLLSGSVPARADVKQLKVYREVYPDAKLQCIYCHTVKKPKKDDHELNAYGAKALEMHKEEGPGAETYKALGRSEDFQEEK